MSRTKRSGADQKKKRSDTLRKIANALKIRKLQSKNKRGRVTSTTSKKMSNIAGDTANKLRAESVYSTVKTKGGMSNLGKGYKKSEKNLSEKATKRTAEISKARYPNMGTYKNKKGESVANEKKNTLKVRKGKSSIEQKNRDRFGDAHVDKLKQKQADFKKMKKKQMTKTEFIKKYPKSITAQKAKGLRK